jgi:hypothetical protein
MIVRLRNMLPAVLSDREFAGRHIGVPLGTALFTTQTVDPSGRRALAQNRLEPPEPVTVTRGENLNPPIREIAHPTAQIQFAAGAMSESAVTHSLNSAGNQVVFDEVRHS